MSTLNEPLLSISPLKRMQKKYFKNYSELKKKSTKHEPTAIQHQNVQPKIVLEVLSAKLTTIVLILTYLTFILCFSFDIYNTKRAFSSSNFDFTPSNTTICPNNTDYNNQTAQLINNTQCNNTNEPYYWNATINNLKNIISFELSVSQYNFTTIVNWTSTMNTDTDTASDNKDTNTKICEIASLVYDVQLYACYLSSGCVPDLNTYQKPKPFVEKREYAINEWRPVLKLYKQTVTISLCDLKSGNEPFIYTLVPNTFQNQVGNYRYIYIRLLDYILNFIYSKYYTYVVCLYVHPYYAGICNTSFIHIYTYVGVHTAQWCSQIIPCRPYILRQPLSLIPTTTLLAHHHSCSRYASFPDL